MKYRKKATILLAAFIILSFVCMAIANGIQTDGGPFMSLMIVFVPQVLVFSVLCTLAYRKTGSVYTGAFTVAAMAAWIVTGGSTMI